MVRPEEKETRVHRAKKEIVGSNGYCHSNKHVQSSLWILSHYLLNCWTHISKNKNPIYLDNGVHYNHKKRNKNNNRGISNTRAALVINQQALARSISRR